MPASSIKDLKVTRLTVILIPFISSLGGSFTALPVGMTARGLKELGVQANEVVDTKA